MARSGLIGTAELRAKLKAAGPLAMTALAAASLEEMEKVMAEAKAITPVQKKKGLPGGTLRSSGTVLPPKIGARSVTTVAGFGGAAKAYALVQHERLDYKHNPGQTAKFLERPFLAHSKMMPRSLAKGVELALKKLGH